jgi:hypothetical protein
MRTIALFAGILLPCLAGAGSLDRLDQVDLIELEPKTAQAHLVVLLEEERVNTRQSLKALYKKVNSYQDAPNISRTVRPQVVVYAPKEATIGELQNLAGLKLAGSKAGIEVEVRAYQAGMKPRPVAIKGSKRTGGA